MNFKSIAYKRSGLILLLLIAGAYLLSLALTKNIDHDEHQYIASGWLLSQQGLWPYKDYMYHHMPYLSFVYAGIFKLTSNYLFGARFFSAFCSFTAMVLLLMIMKQNSVKSSDKHSFVLLAGLLVIYLSNQILRYTSAIAWNHDLAILLLVAGIFFLFKYFRNSKPCFLFLSGFFTGLMLGTRLSYIYAVLPFFIVLIFLHQSKFIQLLKAFVSFSIGFFIALVPLFILILKGGLHCFIDSLFYYHFQLDPAYLESVGRLQTLGERLDIAWDIFSKREFLLPVILVLILLIGHMVKSGIKTSLNSRSVFLFFQFLILLAGIITKSIIFKQYFFVLLPILVLILYEVLHLHAGKYGYYAYFAVVVIILVSSYHRYASTFTGLLSGRYDLKVYHENSEALAKYVQGQKVLTLSPVYCLDAGGEIFPQFVNAVFSWRAASILTLEEANQKGFVTALNIGAFIKKNKVKYIYTGFEKTYDQALDKQAELYGYSLVEDHQINGRLYIKEYF